MQRQRGGGPVDLKITMNPALQAPIALFRFALRESDWPLAARLATALVRSQHSRKALETELARPRRADKRLPSLLALRSLGLLLPSIGLRREVR